MLTIDRDIPHYAQLAEQLDDTSGAEVSISSTEHRCADSS